MQNSQDTVETQNQTFISAFPICVTAPLSHGTKIRTGITCKKIPCYRNDLAWRWYTVKKAKIF